MAIAAAATKRGVPFTENDKDGFDAAVKRVQAVIDPKNGMMISSKLSTETNENFLRRMDGCNTD